MPQPEMPSTEDNELSRCLDEVKKDISTDTAESSDNEFTQESTSTTPKTIDIHD